MTARTVQVSNPNPFESIQFQLFMHDLLCTLFSSSSLEKVRTCQQQELPRFDFYSHLASIYFFLSFSPFSLSFLFTFFTFLILTLHWVSFVECILISKWKQAVWITSHPDYTTLMNSGMIFPELESPLDKSVVFCVHFSYWTCWQVRPDWSVCISSWCFAFNRRGLPDNGKCGDKWREVKIKSVRQNRESERTHRKFLSWDL